MVIGALGLGILLIAIILAYTIFSATEVAQPLIVNVAELRNSAGDPVKNAKLVAHIGDLAADSTELVQDQWSYMTECLPTGCVDDEYFNMILIISQEYKDELQYADLISNSIIAHRFWGSEDVVEFSRALSEANDGYSLIKSKQVRNKWNEIVECKGECAHMNDLFFEIILLLLE